jgi:hypothetical protein
MTMGTSRIGATEETGRTRAEKVAAPWLDATWGRVGEKGLVICGSGKEAGQRGRTLVGERGCCIL